MVNSTKPVHSSSALLPRARDKQLVLLIRGNRRAGQVVRLTSDKCTIGSGSRCTLRLVAREVKPLHCLILRGSARTVVRCWAPDTLLNGRAFRDAELNVGDRLAIGPIELEVLAPGGAYLDTSATYADSPDGEPIEQRELRSIANRLRFASHPAAVGSDREAFEHKCQAWETSRKRVEAEIAQLAEQVDAHRIELEAERDAVNKDRDDWKAIRAETESRLADRARSLDRREADLDRRQSEPVSAAPILDRLAADAGSPASRLPDTHEEAGGDDSLARPTKVPPSQPDDYSAYSALAAGESVDEYMNRLLEGAPSPTRATPLGDASAEPLGEPRTTDSPGDLAIGGSERESAEEVVDLSTRGVTNERTESEPPPAEKELSRESANERPTASRKSNLRNREARFLAESRNLPLPLHAAEEPGEDDNLPPRLGPAWLVAAGVILGAAATGCWWAGWLNSIAFCVVLAGLWMALAWFVLDRLSDREPEKDST